MKPRRRVAVAMSGGVDSSTVAAWLLEQNCEVVGLTMQLWNHGPPEPGRQSCCASRDLHDARQVADRLDIPFYVINLETAFQKEVVTPYLADYRQGRTPNPCILCNQTMKFKLLLDQALALEAEFLATGHYATRREDPEGWPELWCGADPLKDQSYFLFSVTIPQLRRLRFPLGPLTKRATRELAHRLGLPVADKKESQDLCFVARDDYDALHARSGGSPPPGEIVDQGGRVLGNHGGIHRFTVGQRHGLGIGGHHHPWYVVTVDATSHRVVVGPEAALWRQDLTLSGFNWLGREPPAVGQRLGAKIRYAAPPALAVIATLDDQAVRLHFEAPQRAIAPGQAVVLYDQGRVMGGGWINPGDDPC